MRSDDPDPQAGPLWKREDYKASTSALMCLQQERGKRYASYSDAYDDKTAQHIGSYNSTKFGMAQPELANVLLTTDFILFFVMVTKHDMVEFSTLGKFSTVARVATRRMARPEVVGEMYFEMYKYMYIFRDLEKGLSKTKSVWT